MDKRQHQQQVELDEQQQMQEQSQYSSEDQDGKLLTNKVQEKLLTVVAKLKAKDPNMYNITKPIFQDDDFQEKDKKIINGNKLEQKNKNGKMSYKDLATQKDKGQSESEQQENKKQLDLDQIKQNFKKKLTQKKQIIHNKDQKEDDDNEDLFKIKKKIQLPKKSNQQKLKQFVSSFEPQSSQLLTNLWKNEKKLDKTDLFLKNYIINQKWKTSNMKINENQKSQQQMIDQQDQQRSIQMDQYQQKYNFRFQQPGSDKITQYPRQIPQSIRQKSQSRKQKRKKLSQRKKQQQQQIRKQYQQKKAQKKQQIITKLKQQDKIDQQNNQQNSQQFEHDWFFCDDCLKPLQQKQQYYICKQCGQYILCQQCHQLIIHKHKMQIDIIPIGLGPPSKQKAQKQLKKLKSCKNCHIKIQQYKQYYQYNQKSTHMLLILCQKCYDQSNLQIKKKYKLIEPKIKNNKNINYQQIIDKNPQKIKQLTTQKDIQQLVDQYIKYDFQDIIGDGIKTKFKYINVKPQSYGLSDQQILYGDDKQLNNYISIKKLNTYQDQNIKLKNNMYNKKIKYIQKTVSENKKLLNKMGINGNKLRLRKKMQTRAQLLRKRRQNKNNKLKIINFSNPQNQKKYYIPNSRLQSYGLATEPKSQNNNRQK